ncbi:MAG: hypothetical protein ACR2F6_15975 [Mycobacteriales bacterium]
MSVFRTTDGRYLGHSPYLTWADGKLVLAGQRVYSTATNTPTEEDYKFARVGVAS